MYPMNRPPSGPIAETVGSTNMKTANADPAHRIAETMWMNRNTIQNASAAIIEPSLPSGRQFLPQERAPVQAVAGSPR